MANYLCLSCKSEFESLKSREKPSCPSCGSSNVVLKGTTAIIIASIIAIGFLLTLSII